MAYVNPNWLLVEGDEDKRVVPYLMGYFIPWGNKPETWPVHIESYNGVEELLKYENFQAALKTPGLKALGVLVDADTDPGARWNRIRDRIIDIIPEIPQQLPAEGLICEATDGLRFGVWLMPDNRSQGMLETFLRLLVPPPAQALWAFVKEHCQDAKYEHQAPYKEAHFDKVNIHAWLALQDPPGQSLHLAVMAQTLKPNSAYAAGFVNWFRTLYGL